MASMDKHEIANLHMWRRMRGLSKNRALLSSLWPGLAARPPCNPPTKPTGNQPGERKLAPQSHSENEHFMLSRVNTAKPATYRRPVENPKRTRPCQRPTPAETSLGTPVE